MAKRARISGRPTSRPRPARPAGSASGAPVPPTAAAASPTPRTPASLTEDEARRAAEIEAELVAQEKAAAKARAAALAARARRAGGVYEHDPELLNQPLSIRASREYAYVARDVRHIGLTAALMLAILLGLAVAINVAGVIKI